MEKEGIKKVEKICEEVLKEIEGNVKVSTLNRVKAGFNNLLLKLYQQN